MMDTISFPRQHPLNRAIVFVLVAALVAAVIGCVEGGGFEYSLSISSTAGGSVTSPGQGSFTYEHGTVVNLVAEAQQGHRFVSWTGNVGTVEDIEAAETTVTVNGDYAITANFEAVPIATCDFTVSSTAGGLVAAPGEGTFTYDADAVVSLVAVADECYQFVNWSGDGVSDPYSANTTVSITIGLDDARSVTANFAVRRHELSANSTAGGSITAPGEGTFEYDCGARVILAAIPEAGYRFAGWSGDVEGIEDADAAEITVTMSQDRAITASFVVDYEPMVDGGIWHTVGLRSDGTVVATGWNEYDQCEVGDWSEIIQVAAGEHHTVGLKSNGAVVAGGNNQYSQCSVAGWSDIIQVDAGKFHTVGLRSDGRVVAAGWNAYGQCDVVGWSDMVQVAAGFYHTVGLKSDGTVVAVGFNGQGRLNVDGWSHVVQVAAGGHQSVGLRSDGTVVVVGRNNYGECNVEDWVDIVHVAAGCQVTIGLRSDGRVVARGWNQFGQCNVSGWVGIVQVTGGMGHSVGLRSDGTVLAVGRNHYGQCDVGVWMLGAAEG